MPARSGVLEMMRRHLSKFTGVRNFLVNGDYRGENFANAVKNWVGAEGKVTKGNDRHKFFIIPQRWLVARSLGWLEK